MVELPAHNRSQKFQGLLFFLLEKSRVKIFEKLFGNHYRNRISRTMNALQERIDNLLSEDPDIGEIMSYLNDCEKAIQAAKEEL